MPRSCWRCGWLLEPWSQALSFAAHSSTQWWGSGISSGGSSSQSLSASAEAQNWGSQAVTASPHFSCSCSRVCLSIHFPQGSRWVLQIFFLYPVTHVIFSSSQVALISVLLCKCLSSFPLAYLGPWSYGLRNIKLYVTYNNICGEGEGKNLFSPSMSPVVTPSQ